MAGYTDILKKKTKLNRRYSLFWFFTLSVVVFFGGCSKEENSELRVAFTDVKPLIKTWDEAFGEHEIIPFFKDSPEKEIFTISWIGINSKGDYIIRDGKIRKTYQFDKTGKFVRTIGRQGQGPGEYDIPRFSLFDENDNLYVYDSGPKKVLKYSYPNYQFEKDFKIGRSAQDFYRDDKGNFVIYSLYSMEYNDVLFKLSPTGEILRTAFAPKFKNFRIFIARFQIGGFEVLDKSNELLFLYPFDYEFHLFDKELNLKKVLYPSRSSSFTPKGDPFPHDWNPYDYSPKIAKWWGKKLHPIVLFELGQGVFLAEVVKYDNFNTTSFANIHDTDGNTYAEGLEVPHSIIRYSKDGYIYIVEDSYFDEEGNVTPLRLHRYTLKINKKR